MARGFDHPQQQRFQGGGPGPGQRRAATYPAGLAELSHYPRLFRRRSRFLGVDGAVRAR
jgi:hypothetical protein